MKQTGRNYCEELHYEFSGPIHSQILCHCRECRYLSGGAANTSVMISEASFKQTKGTQSIFARSDLETSRTRYFCGNCGTHICFKSPWRPGTLVLKISTLNEHSWFKPDSAIFFIDKQEYHMMPEGVLKFARAPWGHLWTLHLLTNNTQLSDGLSLVINRW